MNTEEDPFVTYRKRRSRYTGDLEDIQLEDISSNMEQTCIHSDRGKGTREDEYRMKFRNLVSALQDLAKGKKYVRNAINRLSTKPEPGNSSTPPSLKTSPLVDFGFVLLGYHRRQKVPVHLQIGS